MYNYVSGTDNPILWEDLRKIMVVLRNTIATNKCIYYPFGWYIKSKIVFDILNFFLHFLPALIVDLILKLIGKKPM